LKQCGEETGGYIFHSRLEFDGFQYIETRDRGQIGWSGGRNWRQIAAIGGSTSAIHRTVWHLPGCAVLAGFARMLLILGRRLSTRTVRSVMRQAAHATTRRHLSVGGAGEHQQGCAQQQNDHKNGLRTTHRVQGNTNFCDKAISVGQENTSLRLPAMVLRGPKRPESRS
jgi:hypothetical protein